MKVLFLTIAWPSLGDHNLYTDLMDEFVDHGHRVTVICTAEARYKQDTTICDENGIRVLRVKTGNLTKTPFIEKGISNLLLGHQIMEAVNKYLPYDDFDLIIMSTPPITLAGVFADLKKKYNAKTYLLLKDIWPQGIADIGAISQNGIIYKFFARQEHKLYQVCDYIGCLSAANVKFVLKHNKLPPQCIIEENSNSIRVRKLNVSLDKSVLAKYDIPINKCIFIFGGNLGKPQGMVAFMEDLRQINVPGAYFLIIGDGTEAEYVEKFIKDRQLVNVRYMKRLPKDDYEKVCESADVGLILLDERYTIPNFPSRLLSYCENRLPMVCYTDANTDVGEIIEEYGCGIKIVRPNMIELSNAIWRLTNDKELRIKMGDKAFSLLSTNYTVQKSYDTIMQHFGL